ncbi:MAG: AsmA family protein [Phycisphaerae bacterium]|nr:AsmA family protein [Phycisphaerae bacterium]NIP54959.1 AsmA family protein [Phycisphaerae bacterium]NIS52034.1 AsmA family protein [Phycisphaerae bacterium]NIU07615.1 AsmA family protein [Phycisphaerae bacterium]NIU57236.1 AsmA family protein [Phycisphaerae bacterium]
MKKSLKILYIVLSVIVVLLLVIVIAVNLFADSAVKMAIESAGTKTLQVPVAVDSVNLSILGGKIGFKNLVIDNPPGYKHEKLLELGGAKIAVETGSLLTDIVNIKEIKLDGMNVVLEQRGITSNNIQDIIKSLPAKDDEPNEPSEPAGKKLHIDTLQITNTRVKVKLLPIPGKVDTLTLKLAPIEMTDLGGENDIDTGALISKILLAIAGGIAEQGAGILPDDMLGSLTSQLGKLGALSSSVLEAGKDVGGSVIKGAGDATKGITDGIKGLFKPKEDKDKE